MCVADSCGQEVMIGGDPSPTLCSCCLHYSRLLQNSLLPSHTYTALPTIPCCRSEQWGLAGQEHVIFINYGCINILHDPMITTVHLCGENTNKFRHVICSVSVILRTPMVLLAPMFPPLRSSPPCGPPAWFPPPRRKRRR